ncbi:hypothetical protein [Pandoravirus japonicus]|uniref:Uncharacterized protein n=1 Tax=Pandoravirus japonicus TaxID=2823154 RepID=A0A811BM79_9VIRU|nr:hypothetical protein [Pandoravirus japonicus]
MNLGLFNPKERKKRETALRPKAEKPGHIKTTGEAVGERHRGRFLLGTVAGGAFAARPLGGEAGLAVGCARW